MKIILPLFTGIIILFFGIYVSGRLAIYEDFPHFDSVMHFLGGATIAWFVVGRASHRGQWVSFQKTLCITVAVGILWEIAEWFSGVAFAPGSVVYKYFSGGGPLDTVVDVLLDIAGAALFYAFYRRSNSLERLNSKEF